jgi:2-polyprenyl-3-methyl-5-hydroxy-6-metoxy-1,4-benzoquinol methylase
LLTDPTYGSRDADAGIAVPAVTEPLLPEKLADGAAAALASGNPDVVRDLTREMQARHPFVYSLLRDALHAAIFLRETYRAAVRWRRTRREADRLVRAVAVRLESLQNWRQDGNETVAALEQGGIDAEAIKPHIRREAAAYEQFYAGQSEQLKERLPPGAPLARERDFLPLDPGWNVNHALRATHAVALVETMLAAIKGLLGTEERIRWLDIGCGTGRFANSVNPKRFGVEKWDIVGCDLQEGKIAIANRRRARGRRFFAAEAFEMLDSYRARGESFHLVSMFEFLEHLDDPLRFLRRLDSFAPKLIIAGSPLAQKIDMPRDRTPDPAHLWSFSRRGWEQMFALAGFDVVYSSEVRIGTYIGGLDWLTVVCGARELLRARRETLLKPGDR